MERPHLRDPVSPIALEPRLNRALWRPRTGSWPGLCVRGVSGVAHRWRVWSLCTTGVL